MEIKQLEYFRAIVDEGTISGAARALHMTQPPLSYQMKMLEEELQVRLFVRGSKHIRLTEAGKALYVRAESLLTMTDITKREVIKVSQATTIHLGVTPSTVNMMAKYLVKYTSHHPDIRFVIHDGSTFTLKDELENGILDVTTLRTPIALNGFWRSLHSGAPAAEDRPFYAMIGYHIPSHFASIFFKSWGLFENQPRSPGKRQARLVNAQVIRCPLPSGCSDPV